MFVRKKAEYLGGCLPEWEEDFVTLKYSSGSKGLVITRQNHHKAQANAIEHQRKPKKLGQPWHLLSDMVCVYTSSGNQYDFICLGMQEYVYEVVEWDRYLLAASLPHWCTY
jgi:hypothetical protein